MKNLILSIIAISILMFTSCRTGGEPTPQPTTPVAVAPDYHYNIIYKGITYDVNGGTTLGQVNAPSIGGVNTVVNCTEFNKIQLGFVRAYDATLSKSPLVFDGSSNVNLSNFIGVMPQIEGVETNTNLSYKCILKLTGTTDNTDYLHISKDINYDMSTYYINIYEMGLDKTDIYGQTHYIKGTFNVLLKNNEVITGDFCIAVVGVTY